jgi:hypothetical protein
MLQYLDTVDSDSDFILESDTDDKSEGEEDDDAPHVTPPAAHPVLTVKRMTWMVKTTGKFCHLSNLSLFLSNSKNCLDLSICLLLILLLLLTSHLHRLDSYPHGDRIQQICAASD